MRKSNLFRGSVFENINKKQIIQTLIVVLTVACFFLLLLFEDSKVYKECFVEAGVEVKAQDFLKNSDEQAAFTDESDDIDISHPGEYHLSIKTGYFTHKSTLFITDSIAPEGKPVKVKLEIGKTCDAEEFVTDVTDATEVQVTYLETPDFSKTGKQNVKVVLADLGGNQTVIDSELFISQVVPELTIEAGSAPPQLKDFVIEGEEAEFISPIEDFDYLVPSDETVTVRVDGTDYKVLMHIVDTIPPTVETRVIEGFTLLPRKPEDFISSIEDVTKTTVRFINEPDVKLVGKQTVEISVTDAGQNEVVKQVNLTLQDDTEAPVISGVTDLNVIIGNSISYKKNVTVSDNCPEGLTFTVDNSAVNLNAEGTYPITYIAKDYAGNETTASANVIVKPRVYTESEVYALADAVLARIISEGMTPLEKVQAIYNYNMRHISYISHSEKGNWLRAAYEGLVDGKGDCYVYASTAKVLLTRAGITNMDIVKIPSKTSHYWNLVNLGEGWYHFDTTPRKDHPTIFMWTEAQMMEYSARFNGSHNYDHSLYPVVN